MNVETAKRIAMAKPKDAKKLTHHPYLKTDKSNRARSSRFWLVINGEEYEISIGQLLAMGDEVQSFLKAVTMDRFSTPQDDPPDKRRWGLPETHIGAV